MKCIQIPIDGLVFDLDANLNERILALEEAVVQLQEAVAQLQEAAGQDSVLTQAAIVAVQANIDDAREREAAKIAKVETEPLPVTPVAPEEAEGENGGD